MAKSKPFWATRNERTETGNDAIVLLWRLEDDPQKDARGEYSIPKSRELMLVSEFEAMFGCTVEPGEKKKYQLVEK